MWGEMLTLALREIRRNVLRSSLTMLGVVIGVAAVIVMVTLGRGATARVTQDIESSGRTFSTSGPVGLSGRRRRPRARVRVRAR